MLNSREAALSADWPREVGRRIPPTRIVDRGRRKWERVKTGKRGRGERRKVRVTENSSHDGNYFRRERDRARMGARAREIRRRRRRSSPASPRDGNSVAREGAMRRERNGREGGEVLLPPLLVMEIPSRERERGGETREREEKFSSRLSSWRKFRRVRGSEEERLERGRRSSPPASPRDGNSVVWEGARRRD